MKKIKPYAAGCLAALCIDVYKRQADAFYGRESD